MQACKPGSVSLCRDPYHLSGPVVTGGIYRPTHPAEIIQASNPYP